MPEDELEPVVEFKPFTQEDLDSLNEQEGEDNFCNTCIYEENCITLQFQNKLSIFRDGIAANERWGCSLHKTEDEALEDMENEEVVQ